MVRKATPFLNKVIDRVRRLTKPRGGKKLLAIEMGVSQQHLTNLLSGSCEPGGEITLRLLDWVTRNEAKNKKTPSVLQARPTRMAQAKKDTSNEKPRSDQRKR